MRLTADERRSVSEEMKQRLSTDQIVILPPMDVFETLSLVRQLRETVACTMLDPWYNKGHGGEIPNYDRFILKLLSKSAPISPHVYIWGFPEIVATYSSDIPEPLQLLAWLTWYYKNNPSVIRGWRSSQMTCLHLVRPDAKLHPEHFLNEKQMALKEKGKLRYMPGPTSVIEAALLVGFIGRKEQTGHPSQKPVNVMEPVIKMATLEGETILDPMSGSAATGAAALKSGRRAILCDHSEEYTAMAEDRLGLRRLDLSLHLTNHKKAKNVA